MPITASQAQSIDAYYAARSDYNKLLFDALRNAPPDQPPREHPITSMKKVTTKTEEPVDVKRPGYEESSGPKPGEHFRELIEMLREHKINKPDEEKETAAPKK